MHKHIAELTGGEDEHWSPELLFNFHGNLGKTYDLSGGTCGYTEKTLGMINY